MPGIRITLRGADGKVATDAVERAYSPDFKSIDLPPGESRLFRARFEFYEPIEYKTTEFALVDLQIAGLQGE